MAQQAAFGTTLKAFDVLADYTLDTVAYVRNIDAPSLALDALETTEHASSGGNTTAVAGVADAGEMTLGIAWDPSEASHDLLLDLLIARTSTLVQLVWPDTVTDTYVALVTGFEPRAPFDELLTADVRMRMSGKPLIADSGGIDWLALEGSGDPVKLENGGIILLEW